jgi:hypothetical protein
MRHQGALMEVIDARLKLAQVLQARTALETACFSVVRIEPVGVPVQLEFYERDQRWFVEHEVYSVTFYQLFDLWIGPSEEATEMISQYCFIPSIQRHQRKL